MAMMGIILFVLLMIAITYIMSWVIMALVLHLLFGKFTDASKRVKEIIKK